MAPPTQIHAREEDPLSSSAFGCYALGWREGEGAGRAGQERLNIITPPPLLLPSFPFYRFVHCRCYCFFAAVVVAVFQTAAAALVVSSANRERESESVLETVPHFQHTLPSLLSLSLSLCPLLRLPVGISSFFQSNFQPRPPQNRASSSPLQGFKNKKESKFDFARSFGAHMQVHRREKQFLTISKRERFFVSFEKERKEGRKGVLSGTQHPVSSSL